MQNVIRGFLAALICVCGTSAMASPLYEFRFDQPSGYFVGMGEQVQVRVYLYETVGPTNTSVFAAGGEGLQSVGARLSYTGTTANTATISSVAGGVPTFDYFTPYAAGDLDGTNPIAGVLDYTLSAGALGEQVSSDTYRMLVGTFTFTAGSVAEETTTIEVSDLFATFDDTLTFNDFTVLDPLITGGVTTITVVPEPPSVVAFSGLAVMGVLFWCVHFVRRPRRA